MFQLTINEKGGPSRQESFEKNEITIGRVQGNDVILPKGNISKRHSRIVLKDGKFIIVDLKSTNGTYVNGKKITAPQVIKSTDKIYIGDFTIQLVSMNGAGAQASVEPREASSRPQRQKEEEIDLFGGDAPLDLDEGPRGGTPGLIDDNFDQEFGAPDAGPSKLPKPKRGGKAAAVAEAEPLPNEHELDLDEDFGDALAEPEPELDPEPEPEPELEPDLDEPKAPVVPMKKKASVRGGPSRIRPIPGRPRPEPTHDEPAEVGALEPMFDEPPTPEPSERPSMPMPAVAAVGAPALDRAATLRALHVAVVDELGLRGLELSQLPNQRGRAVEVARRFAQQWRRSGRIDASIDVEDAADAVGSLATDLDLILDLIQDESCVEIAVTYDRQMLADREGRLEPIDRMISSEDQVVDLIRRLGVLGGANPGTDEPMVDVRLRDGSRVVATLPPLSFRGPTLSFRKTTRDWFTLDKLFEYSTISKQMMDFIDYCVRFRANMLLSVGPGVSPTATMNALVAQMPTDDRIVTIENGVELHFGQTHRNVTALEPSGGFGIAELVHHAVTMQADRLVLGELAGDAVPLVLQAVSGPLEGSVCGYSAGSPAEAVDRLARVELHPFFGDATADAKRLVASAFPVVIQERKFLDNSRRITAVSEVIQDGDEVVVEDIFQFKPEGVDDNLIVTGSFHATGHRPTFLEELADRGEAEIDLSIFDAS